MVARPKLYSPDGSEKAVAKGHDVDAKPFITHSGELDNFELKNCEFFSHF